MPEIARFYGIVVKMFYKPKEHEPAHIHVLYGEYVGVYYLDTCQMFEGDLPLKARKIVEEWLDLHKANLRTMWNTQVFYSLPPL
ncbi:MAG: DUF4160 domain-containing protein [Actinomycetaceae bacterium]|nr:DUF4160 domain-containing protein [Actinomycetaceae bacterium]